MVWTQGLAAKIALLIQCYQTISLSARNFAAVLKENNVPSLSRHMNFKMAEPGFENTCLAYHESGL